MQLQVLPDVEEIQLANKYEALAWICKNQLGRRNLSPERKKFLLGKEYESTKLAVGGQPGNCNKEERPAILEELKKKKSDRDDTVLERLKPSKPPPKPKSAPQKKKPTATENNTTSQAEQPETPVQETITESPPEEEIEPTSNAPPSFLQSIQGHKRHLSEEDKARLQASVDARYQDKAAATGSIMLCELQGATEEFIFRWNVIFQEHPDVLTDKTCRKTIFELLDRMTNYLKTIKEEKL